MIQFKNYMEIPKNYYIVNLMLTNITQKTFFSLTDNNLNMGVLNIMRSRSLVCQLIQIIILFSLIACLNVSADEETGPDIMSLGTSYPDVIYIDKSFEIEDSVINLGNSPASIVRIEYGLSLYDSGIDNKKSGNWKIMNLGPDKSKKSTRTLSVPYERPGFYYLVKNINVISNPPEVDTDNNRWISNTPLALKYSPDAPVPDLIHVKTDFPCRYNGGNITVTDTITNIGNTCAKDYIVAYYISTYEDYNADTAILLGTSIIDNLCPGEQITNEVELQIFGNLKDGSYYLFSVINPCSYLPECSDFLPELDTTNNLNAGKIQRGDCPLCRC